MAWRTTWLIGLLGAVARDRIDKLTGATSRCARIRAYAVGSGGTFFFQSKTTHPPPHIPPSFVLSPRHTATQHIIIAPGHGKRLATGSSAGLGLRPDEPPQQRPTAHCAHHSLKHKRRPPTQSATSVLLLGRTPSHPQPLVFFHLSGRLFSNTHVPYDACSAPPLLFYLPRISRAYWLSSCASSWSRSCFE